MLLNLKKMKEKFLKKIAKVENVSELEEVRLEFLGKKGTISQEMKLLGKLAIEEKKSKGQEINQIKNFIVENIAKKQDIFAKQELDKKIEQEGMDLTLPARKNNIGSIHPITKVINDIVKIFENMGFLAVEGPEIEDDFHNFTALNIPENHPARQMHDTFYLKNMEYLLRTHTSSVQIRTMQKGKPPFAIVAPGKTYRSDSDATHTPIFHQIEVLYIAKKASMANLKFVIKNFLDSFFKEEISLRFRSSFFPFTEPSAEVDIECMMLEDKIDLQKRGDFLEIMGCGMVHPNVLKAVNIDPTEWSGFALGLGVERVAMLKYGMRDLRKFFNSSKNWINSYNFKTYDI